MKEEKIKFWIIVIGLTAWLLFSVFTFVYFKTECKVVEENPLKYSAEKYDIDLCTCFTTGGTTLFFNKTKVWYVQKGIPTTGMAERFGSLNITG